jgi:hypothetical protein
LNANSNPGVYGKTGSIVLIFQSQISQFYKPEKNHMEITQLTNLIKESTALQFGHPILANTMENGKAFFVSFSLDLTGWFI